MRDLVGRDAELDRIRTLLDGARRGTTGVVAIEGEAGIGKTHLLHAAAEAASGFRPLWAHGIGSESMLGHAVLLELLRPLRSRVSSVPAAQAHALAAALGWGPANAPGDRYLVAAGTLSLLALAAEDQPLLVLVDDVQWVDVESAEAVTFAARRMHHDRVAFLFASRPGAGPRLDGIEVLGLQGLTVEQAARLLPDDVAGPVVRALVDRLRGNALALREVVARLSESQRRGAAPLPHPLPIGDRLAAVFEPLIDGLSPAARQAARLLAADADESAVRVRVALDRGGLDGEAAIGEAERRGVVWREGGALRFRHPLLRSTVWRLATPPERRAAHRALAEAEAGDRTARVWHLAEAAEGPDDDLATALVGVAAHARTRRGFGVASTMLERAAHLTSDAGRTATLLAAAVDDAFVAGDLDRAKVLADRVRTRASDAPALGAVLFTLGRIEEHAGSVPTAAELLRAAAEVAEGQVRVWALAELAMVQYRLDDITGMRETAVRLEAAADAEDPEAQVLACHLGGVARLLDGEAAVGRRMVLHAWELLTTTGSLQLDPRFLVHALLCAVWLEVQREAQPHLERRLAAAREQGALGVLVPALAMTSHGRAMFGDHAGSFADAGEAVELAELLRYVADAAPALELLAWQSASRGLHEDAQESIDRAAVLVRRAGTTEAAAHLAVSRAFCALCRGDLAETIRVLEARIAVDGGRGSMGEPLGVAPLLVEAYAGSGRRAEAAAMAERYAEATQGALPGVSALVARCRALAADDPGSAAGFFEDSLASHAQAPDAFEAARTRLLYGSMLRRAGRRIDARSHLRQASETFTAWDLTHWAHLAEAELRGTGATARARGVVAREPLTSQETRVAGLVARGMTNREVAAALFLSPKTIEHHLSSIYRKRGVRSRAQLTAALLARDPPS